MIGVVPARKGKGWHIIISPPLDFRILPDSFAVAIDYFLGYPMLGDPVVHRCLFFAQVYLI
jgi:hypothetical protein